MKTLTNSVQGKTLILDIETDSLNPTLIWCVVAKHLETGTFHDFTIHNKQELQDLLKDCTTLVCHYGIEFDLPTLLRLWDIPVNDLIVQDTLVLSKLYQYDIKEGHSLEAWGDRLGIDKLHIDLDFSIYTDAIVERCRRDVEITEKLYLFLKSKLKAEWFDEPCRIEMRMAQICRDMHNNGFYFDFDQAKKYLEEVNSKLETLDRKIHEAFPPQPKLLKEYTVKFKKNGEVAKGNLKWFTGDFDSLQEGQVLKRFTIEDFNPASPKQVCERLKDYWSPVDKTDAHLEAEKAKDREKLEHFKDYGWKINEANLQTLSEDAPEGARLLVERLLVDGRRRVLDTWISCYKPETHRIHGDFISIGTWTQRLAHRNPNMGNIAAEKTIKYKSKHLREIAIDFGGRFRKLWLADSNRLLVGCDMEGAHLRIFAHLINDKKFTEALISGNKKDGTDPHTLNKNIIGPLCPDRDLAKTFIFTFLNGGGVGKVSEIFGCSKKEASSILSGFIRAYPGLAALKESRIPKDAKRGFFQGLDGRLVFCNSEHHMIAGYLQNAEAVLMKHANVLWYEKLEPYKNDWKQVNLVHDEFQTEVKKDLDFANFVGYTQAQCIKEVGEKLKLNCPLAGEVKIADNWLDSH